MLFNLYRENISFTCIDFWKKDGMEKCPSAHFHLSSIFSYLEII